MQNSAKKYKKYENPSEIITSWEKLLKMIVYIEPFVYYWVLLISNINF